MFNTTDLREQSSLHRSSRLNSHIEHPKKIRIINTKAHTEFLLRKHVTAMRKILSKTARIQFLYRLIARTGISRGKRHFVNFVRVF